MLRATGLFSGLNRLLPSGSRRLRSDQLHPKRLTLPDQSRVVICGGGIIGCSVAYHLAKAGWSDVVVLEKGSISGGTTWHAAGLANPLKGSLNDMKLGLYAVDLFPKLEEETGCSTGWRNCGNLIVARTRDRMMALRRSAVTAKLMGVEAHVLSPQECHESCPLIRYDDLQGGLWYGTGGTIGPSDLCAAFVKGAAQKGVKMFEKVTVNKVLTDNGAVAGVSTSSGDIKCDVFINCAGMWARDLGKLSNPMVRVPLHATEHFYIVTKPLNEMVDPLMPITRDVDGYFYMREWGGGLLCGVFEPVSKPVFSDGIPDPFEFQLFPEDWDHFQRLMDEMLFRVPVLETAEIRQMVNGPESFTPDGKPILGEAPEIKNYFVAAGFNSCGILASAGAGLVTADWVTTGAPRYDMSPSNINRFGAHHISKKFLYERVLEVVGTRYAIPYPKMEHGRARNVKCSPLYSLLDSAGASWGEKMGWERANWFAKSPHVSREFVGAYGRPDWFSSVHEEHLNCRNNVSLFDASSFAKFEVEGDQAVESMQMLCTNSVNVPIGKVVYTGMLNERGGYETDCTVTRTAANKYLVVCPTAQITHIMAWMSRHLPSSVQLRDVTNQYTVISVMGPQSRKLLECLTAHSLDDHHFPFGTSKIIEVGLAPEVRASRISFVGELGWELYIPNEYACAVYSQLFSHTDDGIHPHNAGYYALDSLRIEKGYRHWGAELDTETTPLEAGLGYTVDFSKNFIGKEALLKQKETTGVKQRVAIFTLDEADPDNFLWGGETVLRDGRTVGYLTSAAYGHTIDRPIGMGLVTNPTVDSGELLPVTKDYVTSGSYQINIAGVHYPATVSLSPLYDPKSLRIKQTVYAEQRIKSHA